MLLLLLIILLAMAGIFVYILLKKPGEENILKPFILDDDNFVRNRVTGEVLDDRVEDWCFGPLRGHSLLALPRETQTMIDFTGPPGSSSKIYYSLCFQLAKWLFRVQRADEWIEVSPIHKAYYDLTIKQKEELEAKIKAGLTSAAQAVADLELLKHDERKYREFLVYFGFEFSGNEFKELKEKRDEHSIKAMFVDLVDVHTGEGISMRSIVTRWPTIITDFIKLADEDVDIEKVKKKLNVSKAEAVVLVTKNKLYQQWKKMFEPQLKERYRRITELVKSREESVKSYREWLAPFIARHKMIEEGLARPGERGMMRTFFIPSAGHATSISKIVIWTWRELKPVELYKGGTERLAQEISEKKVDPYDEWTKRNLIFHPKHGLVVKYPWITDEWVRKQREWMLSPQGAAAQGWIVQSVPYWALFVITINKFNIRTADGSEMEDCVFDINSMVVSQNVLFTKLLELMAKQDEFNHYIDSLIGIAPELPTEKEVKIRRHLEPVRRFLNFFTLGLEFLKPGPYERDFHERISYFLCRTLAVVRYTPIVGFIKKKMGMGM